MKANFYILLLFFIGIFANSQEVKFEGRLGAQYEKFGIKKGDKWLVEPKYEKYVDFDKNGIALVATGKKWFINGKAQYGDLWGIVNKEGFELTEQKYLSIHSYENGAAIVEGTNRLLGFIDLSGKEILETKYLEVTNFNGNGHSIVTSKDQNGKEIYQKVDKKGNLIKAYKNVLEKYTDAAKDGNLSAMNEIGAMYLYGDNGVEKNYTLAKEWFLKSSGKGNGSASRAIGMMYQYGYGVNQDFAKAIEWYNKAIEQKDTDAIVNFGLMYEKGQGQQKNSFVAFGFYQEAANKNNLSGYYNLARCHHYGIGTAVDFKKAIDNYIKSEPAYSNSPAFYNEVAYCYLANNQVDNAISTLNIALKVDPNYANGYDSLGEMYLKKGDREKAISYYKKSAQMGLENAKKWCKENNIAF